MSFRETFFKTNSLKFETYLIKISYFRSNTHSFYYSTSQLGWFMLRSFSEGHLTMPEGTFGCYI